MQEAAARRVVVRGWDVSSGRLHSYITPVATTTATAASSAEM